MPSILCIESAADVCSVALADTNNTNAPTAYKEVIEPNAHSKYLTSLIEEVLSDHKPDAVAVSMGPGSYTGLRIGASAAKGICYALDIPLIAIDTLEIVAYMIPSDQIKEGDIVIPMLDARRMEVYHAIMDHNLNFIQRSSPLILEEDSFKDLLDKGKVHFTGNGAAKFSEIMDHPNAIFHTLTPSLTAKGMVKSAIRAFKASDFVDVAYFEPAYLKPVMATKPKNKWF